MGAMQTETQSERTPPRTRPEQETLRRDEHGTSDWQRKLLPFMIAMIAGLAIFFFWISVSQLQSVQQKIEQGPTLDLAPALGELERSQLSASDRLLQVQWQTLALLEQHALEQRYHQANVLLMSRTWIRYLGFITGMILALVGAAFILGKLREDVSDLSVNASGANVALKSTSPGLIMSVLGTGLMLATILVHNEITTRDGPVYTNFLLAPAQSSDVRAAPPLLWDEQRPDSAILSELEQ